MDLNTLMGINYAHLLKTARYIAKDKRTASDLLVETYLDLEKKKCKIPLVNNEFIKFFVASMKIQYKGKRTAFGKSSTSKELLIDYEIEMASPETESTKADVLIPEVIEFKKSLTGLDLIFFELVYEKKLSYRKIAYLYNMQNNNALSVRSIYELIKPLKQKIKTRWKI